MARVLYLPHRLPYPPDKGDKVRSHHILQALSRRHRVRVGTFIDDPHDLRHVAALSHLCDEPFVCRLGPIRARLRALLALLGTGPVSVAYYRDRSLRRWVRDLCERSLVDVVVVSSSQMATYVEGLTVPVLMDFIDVDSDKWRQYGESARGVARWLYRRESSALAVFERQVAGRAYRSFFVSRRELDLFQRQAGSEAGARARVLDNGVDTEYFAPAGTTASPYPAGEIPVVFTGTMSYRPNADAVTWFAQQVLPVLRPRWPALRLSIVGRHPAADVKRLEGPAVRVTGAVDDVRPWLQHAAVAVAPVRMACGVQNKILEALAMARPVVASAESLAALDVVPGLHVTSATGAAGFAEAIDRLLADPAAARRMGAAGRQWMQTRYDWTANLAPLLQSIEETCPQ